MPEDMKLTTFKLPLPIREGLSSIALEHGQILKGHGYTGQPNMTWAICWLVEQEMKRAKRRQAVSPEARSD